MSEPMPLRELSDYLEAQARRWETEHAPHGGDRCAFRDGVVSGYRWAKRRIDAARGVEND